MRPGNNAIEFTTVSKNGNGLLIHEDLPGLIHRGRAALTTSEFKMRVRGPNRLAEARPLRTIADLSRRLGHGVPNHDPPVEVYPAVIAGAFPRALRMCKRS